MFYKRKGKNMYKTTNISVMTIREASGEKMNGPAAAAALVSDIADCAQEQFIVLTLNTKNRLIDRHLVSLGTVNSSLVAPREVFRPAIMDAASSVILVHNHPSGDSSPSSQDIQITKKLIEAGHILGISIMDHLIIGRPTAASEGWLSLRETGLVEFK